MPCEEQRKEEAILTTHQTICWGTEAAHGKIPKPAIHVFACSSCHLQIQGNPYDALGFCTKWVSEVTFLPVELTDSELL